MVRLRYGEDPGKEIVTYAALDSMSSASFISEDVWKRLGSPGEPSRIIIKTLSGEEQQNTVVVNNLTVTSMLEDKRICLPKAFMQVKLPIDVSEVPSHSNLLRKWPHLRRLVTELPDRDVNIPIGLLIGVNCPKAMQPCEFIPSADGGPSAVRTMLGWVVSGPMQSDDPCGAGGAASCFLVRSSEKLTRVVETGLNEMPLRSFEQDFNKPLSGTACNNWSMCRRSKHNPQSQEDRKFLTMMEDECRLVDEHCQLPLLLRNRDVVMPNNRAHALQRIASLKKRFSHDTVFQKEKEYIEFMNDIINKGYERKAPRNDVNDESLWFFPHHEVDYL